MAVRGWGAWAGCGLCIVVTARFLMSGTMNLAGVPAVEVGMGQLGLPLRRSR
jgi:hypothetical protein